MKQFKDKTDPYLSSVGNRESVVVVAVDKSYSFFGFLHMIVEPVFFVCPAADVIIARRRLYSEEQRRIVNVRSESVPFAVVGQHSGLFVFSGTQSALFCLQAVSVLRRNGAR